MASDGRIDFQDKPLRPVRFVTPDVVRLDLEDNSTILRSAEPLQGFDERMGDWLDRWATVMPDRPFLVEQTDTGERSVTYFEVREHTLALAGGYLKLNLSGEQPLVIMASNSIDHAIAMLAALYIGIAVAPIAPAYALQTSDFTKLAHSFKLLTPGAVIVEDGVQYQAALQQALDPAIPVFALKNAVESAGILPLGSIFDRDSGTAAAVARAASKVGQATVAKYLFTSGSTGLPKAVINTHGMLCANAQMQRQVNAFVADEPPVMVDWLPWNHTAGGNSVFNTILYNGGTLYIDPGKPTPGLIDSSISLLRRVSPTLFFNVPMGYDAMLPYLEAEPELRERFFCNMRFLWYSAAAMQPATWDALERLSFETVGERILMVSGLGMTETSPLALFGNKRAQGAGVVGVPAPGMELKLIPHDGKLEARYAGPNVTPGYFRNPEATAAAFDEEGYFLSGDLLSFVDSNRPDLGLRFEGRASEDFKLTSGTRVSAGALRLQALEALRPFASDVVIVGEGRNDVRMLIFPDWEQCTKLSAHVKEGGSLTLGSNEPNTEQILHTHFEERLETIAAAGTGGSNRIVAALLVREPPSANAGELTEKGTINARALQRNRPELIQKLFSAPPGKRLVESSL